MQRMNIQTEAKKIMKLRSLTQAELAREAGMHPVTLCLLLKEPKRPDTAYDKLVRYLESARAESHAGEHYHEP